MRIVILLLGIALVFFCVLEIIKDMIVEAFTHRENNLWENSDFQWYSVGERTDLTSMSEPMEFFFGDDPEMFRKDYLGLN